MTHLTEELRADLVDRIRTLSRPMAPLPTGVPARLQSWSGIRAVLFDVYGTLFVSAAGDIAVDQDASLANYEGAAQAAGIPMDPAFLARLSSQFRDAVARVHAARHAEGIPVPEIDVRHIWRTVFDDLERAGGAMRRVHDEALFRFAVEIEGRLNPVWPMPGLREVMTELRRSGLCVGLVSNAQFFTPLLFEALLGERLEALGVDPNLCAWSYAFGEAKPSPRLLQRVLATLRDRKAIEPQHVLFVGNDVLKDLLPAGRAGCRTVLFAGDTRSLRLRANDARCADVKPDAVVTALPQVLQITG